MARPKVFELQEANGLLPELEQLLREWETKHDRFKKLEDELFFEELLENSSPSQESIRILESALLALEEEISKIRTYGCFLRNAEKGLVDFLSKRNEEWIYFCWRRGEERIEFYHTLNGGYHERKPLQESHA